jgi:4-amino-4-deoxy-L-arabinose transferase-like glycosyltransferase
MRQNYLPHALLLAAIFIPRLLHLDVFLTADEPLFLTHAREFAAGLAAGDFGGTLGIGYPGVTVAWGAASVVGLAHTELGAYTAGRLATAILNGLLLLAIYALGRRLWGRWPATLGVGLLALDPYTLAYSRLLQIDAPLALLMTLVGLACLLWLRDGGRRWLLLMGLFGGLALLTKSTALLLGPMVGVVVAGWGVVGGEWCNRQWWRQVVVGLATAGAVATLFFVALWPAMWSQPGEALALTFGKLLTDQAAGTGNMGMFWRGQFVEDPGPAFYPVAFLLKSTPWLLAGLVLSLWSLRAAKAVTTNVTLALWLFALLYLLAMTVASKKSVRYLLPAFPVFYLLAGVALADLRRKWAVLLVLPLVLPIFYHPYYFTYYNPALLGWRWAPQTVLVGWGEGLDEAARYLNKQPAGKAAVWYEWLWPPLYAGEIEPVVPPENMLTADHTVLYINQVQRNIPDPNLIEYFRLRRQPEYTVTLAGIEYAWVYPGPVAGFRPDPAPQHPLTGDFGGEARLLGYDLHPPPRSGDPLIVTLYWRVLATPPGERVVTLRLLDAEGHILAQSDSPPVMGFWPAERWQPEMLLEDAQSLNIPAGTPPGTYRLEVGLYDPASGQVFPATDQPLGPAGGLLLDEVQLGRGALP